MKKATSDNSFSKSEPNGSFTDYYERKISDICDYIHQNLDKKMFVSELAGIICVTPDHFRRIFFKIKGITPQKYIQQIRVERAKEYLLTSSLPIHQIAEKVGVLDLSQFTKMFTQSTGSSPTAYRKNNS